MKNIDKEFEYDYEIDNLQDLHEFHISKETQKRLKSMNIHKLFPIQSVSFDLIYEGKDVFLKEQTGMGKTLAFLLPVLERLISDQSWKETSTDQKKVRVLILCPTFLLMEQHFELIKSLYEARGVNCKIVQKSIINQNLENADVVLTTYSTSIDLFRKFQESLNYLETIIFDEVEQIYKNEYFEPEFAKIHKKFSQPIQYISVSAVTEMTIFQDLKQWMDEDCVTLNLIQIKQSKIPKQIEHKKFFINEKNDGLEQTFRFALQNTETGKRSIIFFHRVSKSTASEITSDYLIYFLVKYQKKLRIHFVNSMSANFQKHFHDLSIDCYLILSHLTIGIDIPQVNLAIAFEFPLMSSYITLAGRVGRANQPGTMIVLYNEKYAWGPFK